MTHNDNHSWRIEFVFIGRITGAIAWRDPAAAKPGISTVLAISVCSQVYTQAPAAPRQLFSKKFSPAAGTAMQPSNR
jgi:hypothetical protein